MKGGKKMQISKRSWPYAIAYGLSKDCNKPEVTNLCYFFWRTVLMLLIGWPFMLLVWYPILFAVGFLFASRPAIFKNDDFRENFVDYKHWPKVKIDREKVNICPLFIMVGIFIPYHVASIVFYNLLSFLVVFMALVCFTGCSLAVVFLSHKFNQLRDRYRRGELDHLPQKYGGVWLLVEYLKAKKQKICPIIHFTD